MYPIGDVFVDKCVLKVVIQLLGTGKYVLLFVPVSRNCDVRSSPVLVMTL
jgi:hypothetical protein